MKKLLCVVGFLVLAAGLPLWGYDTSPAQYQVVPEAIWAAATGGGTWVTEVQITNYGAAAASILVFFDTSAGPGNQITLPGTIPSMNSVKYANILSTIDALDPSATVYYGKVGALLVNQSNGAAVIQVQAQTVNGNYGKTFPGLNDVEGNTAVQGRPMIIQGLVRNATYRTSVGVFSTSELTCTVRFTIYNSAYGVVGSYFEKTVGPYTHLSFNPFVQAGITSGDYDNCWLYIEVTAGGEPNYGLFSYGSLANNYTNDTYALMAKQYGAGTTAAPAPPVRY